MGNNKPVRHDAETCSYAPGTSCPIDCAGYERGDPETWSPGARHESIWRTWAYRHFGPDEFAMAEEVLSAIVGTHEKPDALTLAETLRRIVDDRRLSSIENARFSKRLQESLARMKEKDRAALPPLRRAGTWAVRTFGNLLARLAAGLWTWDERLKRFAWRWRWRESLTSDGRGRFIGASWRVGAEKQSGGSVP